MAMHATSKSILIDGEPVSPEVARALAILCNAAWDAPGDALCKQLRDHGVDAAVDDEVCGGRPSEEQAVVLLDAIGEGVCLGDNRGRILWSNAFFRGLDPATRRLVGERLRSAAQQFLSLRRTGHDPQKVSPLRYEIESEDGGRQFEVFATPAPPRPTDSGDLGENAQDRERAEQRADREGDERVACAVRDVTRSNQIAAKLRAIGRAGEELVRLDSATIKNLNSFERLQLLEEKIVRIFHHELSYDHFAVFLIDDRRKRLELIISAGLPPELQDLELSAEREGSGISGYVAATGETYVCHDASADDRFLPGLVGAKSSLTVPLRIHDRVIGILDIESQAADAFDETAQQFVGIFARYVALALHMLDLLVVERSTTNENASTRVLNELREPLEDIGRQLADLEARQAQTGEEDESVARIRTDLEAIRARLREVAEGPQTLIGVDRASTGVESDPLLAGRRVLVADDQPKIRKVIAAVLRARGCEVEVCPSGETAILALSKVMRGEAAPFDMIVSDIQMPDRNGYEVFASARRANPGAKVILMTGFGYDPHHSIVRASQEGLQGVLFKPFDIEQLLVELRKAAAEKAESE
ncbi:MAG: hypothetical protein CMJ31_10625 [Phycisphaerae bacterium]|nr:hypothetical protein [Phycisphaerae bacterium]